MTLNDLEPPKNGFLVNFSQFLDAGTFQHWIATKWLEIDQDNLHMKFSALNVDFSALSPDPPRFKEASAGEHQRLLPSYKWLFYHNYLV